MVFQFMDWRTSDYLFSFHSSVKFEWVCFLLVNNQLLFQTWTVGLSGMPKLKRSHLVLKVKKEDMVFQFMDWRTGDYLFSFHPSTKFEWVCFLSVNNRLLFQTWIAGLSGMPKLKRSHLMLKVKKKDMVFQFMDWRTVIIFLVFILQPNLNEFAFCR